MNLLSILNDYLGSDDRKREFNWEIRCPCIGGDGGCPSNSPIRGARPPRLKYMQKISPYVYQYKCLDCGHIANYGVERPSEEHNYQRVERRMLQ